VPIQRLSLNPACHFGGSIAQTAIFVSFVTFHH